MLFTWCELGAHLILKLLARVMGLSPWTKHETWILQPQTQALEHETRAKGHARSIVGAGRLQSAPSHASSVRRLQRPFLVTEDEEVVETGAVETELVETRAATQCKAMDEKMHHARNPI